MKADEKQRQALIWPFVLIAAVPLLYWLSAGPFMHWQYSARTRREYHARLDLQKRIYFPIHWLESKDPSHAILKVDLWMIQPWKNTGLTNLATLPDQ
jgi:hypothetical protein